MNKVYRCINGSMSFLRYHFLFCPRYQRKIFLVEGVTERFEQLVEIKCKELECELLDISLGSDYVYLFIDAPANLSPLEIMTQIKHYTSAILRSEKETFSKMPGLWTRKYLVSSEPISEQEKRNFISKQPRRY